MTIEINEGSPSTLSLLFAEGLYTDYLRDPSSVAPDWRAYFDSLGQANAFADMLSHAAEKLPAG